MISPSSQSPSSDVSSPLRCGYIAILGQPNVGKSTLINRLVGQKISIVSPKVQTTRQRILGILCHQEVQMIFMDTPGIFDPNKRLDRAMVSTAWQAGREADEVIVLHDARERDLTGARRIFETLGQKKGFLVFNKVDQVEKPYLLPLIHEASQWTQLKEIRMISARTGEGVEDLIQLFSALLPVGPWLFDADHPTDLPQRLWAAEITREHLYHCLREELPYDTYVETENWEVKPNGQIRLSQVIHVARTSQKSIVVGKKGAKIKEIGQRAREELSHLLGKKVHLFLFIRVTEKWQEKPDAYRLMGLDYSLSPSSSSGL